MTKAFALPTHSFVRPPLIAVALIAGLSLGACSHHDGPKTQSGTVIGAVAGGLIGSAFGRGRGRVAAVATGALIGGALGNTVGRSMDKADRAMARQAMSHSLEHEPTGKPTTWTNPDNGNTGTVTPQATYQEPAGRYCREYQHTVTIGGQTQDMYGTACRQPDGTWQIVKS